MSNPYENVDTLELVDRFSSLIKKYGELALEIAPKLEKFGKYKQELQLLSVEFVRRGYNPQEPDDLKRMVEEALKQRQQSNNGTQTDQTQGNTESRQDSEQPT